MAFKLYEDTAETSTTTGTVSMALGGALTLSPFTYQTFSAQYASGDTFTYAIVNAGTTQREFGIGSYDSGNNTVLRTTVLRSSNSNNPVSFSAGTKYVMVSLAGIFMEALLQPDNSGAPRQPWDVPTRNMASGATTNLVHGTDYLLVVDKGTGSASTVNLPATGFADWRFEVKDGKGDANVNNITVSGSAVSGVGSIDNQATYVISNPYGAATFTYDATGVWRVT